MAKWLNWVKNEWTESQMKQWSPGLVASLASLAWRMQEPKASQTWPKRGNVAEKSWFSLILYQMWNSKLLFFARRVVVFWTKIVIVSILDLSCRSHLSFPSQAVLAAEKRLENPWKTHGLVFSLWSTRRVTSGPSGHPRVSPGSFCRVWMPERSQQSIQNRTMTSIVLDLRVFLTTFDHNFDISDLLVIYKWYKWYIYIW